MPLQGKKGNLDKVWKGQDGNVNEITKQGSLLIWKVLERPTDFPNLTKRGFIMGFSKASRFRLIKLLAKIDWQQAEPCLFITLTVPDEVEADKPGFMTRAKTIFWRYVEKHLGRKTAAIWRIEWKDRKSGERKGELFPHAHLMVFNVKWLEYEKVNEWWGKSLRYTGEYLRTETKAMRNPAQAGYYVSKYCAKLDCSLVNAAYLNKHRGRQWGVLRPSLLPFCEQSKVNIPNSELTEFCRALAEGERPDLFEYGNKSFTMIGPMADRIFALIAESEIDVHVFS